MIVKEIPAYAVPSVLNIAAKAYKWATGRDDFNRKVAAGNWISQVQAGNGVVFVVSDENGMPVGLLCGYKSQNIDTGKRIATMWHWYVEPEARGQGLELLRRFEVWAKEKDCQGMRIGCLAALWDSHHEKVYKRLGYELDGMNFNKEI